MPLSRLDDRAVIAVSGSDAEAFLQGLITNNVEKANPAIYAALLTPQGKVMFDFVLHRIADGFLLDASAEQAGDLLTRLKMYKLRAAVDVTACPDLAVYAAWGDDAPAVKPADPRLPALGRRWIGARDDGATAAIAAYHSHRLGLGVPNSADMGGEFLLDANGEELHAVDFRKGCFVGQEVTARMKHKAKPRRRLMPVAGALPAPGTRLTTESGDEAGEMATGTDGHGMASLRIDRIAIGDLLTADTASVRVEPAAYALPVANRD
jgi:folate-binding protein YgfZ